MLKHNNYVILFEIIGLILLEITAVITQKIISVGINTTNPASKTAPKSNNVLK